MPRRYFNWKLAVVLLISIVVLGVTAFGLRQWRRVGRASQGLVLGNKAYQQQDWEQAVIYLGRYVAVNRNDVPALLKYADAQLNIRPVKPGNIGPAIEAYRIILRIDSSNVEAAKRLVQIYLGIGAPGEAELIARRHPQTTKDPELRRMLAAALARQRKFKEAAAELESIISEHPEQVLAYEALGQLTEDRPEEFPYPAGYWFNEAIKCNPSSALAYIARADFHLRNKDKVKAAADLEQAETLDLTDSAVRLRLAMDFVNTNALDKAHKHLAAVQGAEPSNQTLWQIWARFALRSGAQTKMLEVAELGLKELALQPWDFMPIATELFIRGGEYEKAAACINQLRQKDFDPASTAFLEGLLAEQKGQGFEAVRCWYRAIQAGNRSPRTRLALASCLAQLGDELSAMGQLRTLLSENPGFFEGHLALARLAAQTGNWAEAAEQARVSKQISPDSLEAALLHIQARMQLLAEARTDTNSPVWKDMEKELTWLDNATRGALDVRLLEFRLAMQRGNFKTAQTLAEALKREYPTEKRVCMTEVELLVAQQREQEATALLDNVVKQFPSDARTIVYFITLLARQGKREACEAVIKDALARVEDPRSERTLCLLLADFYDRWGRQEKAYDLLASLVKKLPNDIPAKRRLLRCKSMAKNFERAQQIVSNIKSIEGENGWQWRYEQAMLWFGGENFKDRYPQMVSLLKENLLSNPDDLASRTLLAATYDKGGELQLAISTYQEALARSPRDIRIIVPAVGALYRANEYARADEILRRAARESLYHPQLKRLEVQSLLRRGELSSATDILQDMLVEDPNNRSVCLSLALLQMRQKKFAEADELLAYLSDEEPNSLAVTVTQIESKALQGKADEAVRLCDEVVNKLGNAAGYVIRARTYAGLGQAESAEQDFERATTVEPNNVETWVAKSDFYRSIGRPDKANTAILQALKLNPEDVSTQKRAISLLFASGNPDKVNQASKMLDEALKANPDDGELQLFRANSLLAQGVAPAVQEAKRILRALTEQKPNIRDAWVLLGEILLTEKRPAEAMDVALRGLVHLRDDKALLLLKARAESVRAPDLAIPTLKLVLELNPGDADTIVLLGSTYIAATEPEKAVELLNTQLPRFNGTVHERRIRTALASALYKSGSRDKSREIFDSLYQASPDDPTPLLAEVKAFRDDKQWSEVRNRSVSWYHNHPKDIRTPVAIASDLSGLADKQAKETAETILRTIIDNEPNCVDAIGVLGMLLHSTARPAEAAALYQRILELQPENIIAINNLAWIVCEEQNKYQQALELVERGLAIAPNYIDLIDTRGVVYYRLGEFNKAVQDFRKSVELYPSTVPAKASSLFHLGRALVKLREKEQAVKSLEQALQLNTELGGLSEADVAEAQRLLKELLHGEGR